MPEPISYPAYITELDDDLMVISYQREKDGVTSARIIKIDKSRITIEDMNLFQAKALADAYKAASDVNLPLRIMDDKIPKHPRGELENMKRIDLRNLCKRYGMSEGWTQKEKSQTMIDFIIDIQTEKGK